MSRAPYALDAELWIQNAVTAQSTRRDDEGASINASIAQALATLCAAEQTAGLVEATRTQSAAIAAISVAMQVSMTNAQRNEFNKAMTL